MTFSVHVLLEAIVTNNSGYFKCFLSSHNLSHVNSGSDIGFEEKETLLKGVGVDDDSHVHHRHPWN